MTDHGRKPALMLPGGGARGAYQVGVLKALAEYLPGPATPFPIIAGTSAGAINAAVLASHAGDFAYGAGRLEEFWGSFRCHHIYKTGWLHNLATGAHWLASMTLGGLGIANPKSLLDNEPLARLLARELRTEGIQSALESGALEALLVTASGYSTARAVTFFQAAGGVEGWEAQKRVGRPARINRTLRLMPEQAREQADLRIVEALQIQPSKDLRAIATRHLHRVPSSVRALLRGVGAWGPGRLPSYLLFEAEFCRELIELGHADGLAAREKVEALMAA